MQPSSTTLSALAVAALLSSAAAPALAQGKFVLKLAHSDSADMATSRKAVMADAFAKEVKAKSGGRIEVQVFGAGALGGERDLIEGVKNGFIQGGLASGVMANFYPNAMVTDMPYLFPSNEVADKVMDGPFGQKLSASFHAATGMHNLCFGEVGFRHFSTGKTPVHSPKDLAGLKIRVQETPLYVTEMKSLGAQPTPIAFPETYTALQTGVVDGEENPLPTMIFAKFYEVQKHVTLDGHNYGVDWFVLSDKFYKSLPADLQKVVTESAKLACRAERQANRTFTANGTKILADKGVAVYTPTPAEMAQFRAAAQPPVIEFLKTKVDPKLVDDIQAAVKEAAGKK
ncbi:TRAP transporter substrate-binding protein DctP [Ramlibacter sp.]|uniref:TRAP transporter substrate-binding protein DctP n=1 Tax=Ramlibacter sp. TaxID=1917967 RepID=UPI0026100B6C|nr:TRAP transporter substrate-binding protein DctP [Ramlibacter sp.]MDB5954010.1 Tripartite ATP-independent transporter solute receptor, DctP family [Ramlibacter sp.]